MRFLLGLVVGYSMRGNQKLLITVIATLVLTVYVLLPAIALTTLHLDVQQERRSRPSQTKVPTLKGLRFEDAATKLHSANLNIQVLATRFDLPPQPRQIIDQNPQPGEEVVAVTLLALP
ncbi:MAG: PASTA domain-containing protein [Pyrinomonadaceae bacterium]|nr:PASTA domain-containing protein [Pyrinomonadaceae bacterium]